MVKRETIEGTKLSNQESIRKLGEKRKLQVLWNIGSRQHEPELEEKVRKENLRRTKKHLKANLYSRNLMKGKNTWAVATKEEPEQMD